MKVKANVDKTVTVSQEIEITGITLLSAEEAVKLPQELLNIEEWWWLRSPGYGDDYAAGVNLGGSVYYYGISVDDDDVCIRPALKISNQASSDLKSGDQLDLFDYKWTVIDGYLLCDSSIGKRCFRRDWKAEDANDYEKSDVKMFLEDWLSEQV